MNLKNKPYSIYAHDQKSDRDGLWFRVRSFGTMVSAIQSLKGLTKKPKEKRDLIYIILPNQGEVRKHILFKDEHIETALKSGK